MDPLSISASIVGISIAAAKITSVLINFVQQTKTAPKVAHTILGEVTSLSTILSSLQAYLLGTANASKTRAGLILVEQVIVVLAECVTTFSELEDVLGTSKSDTDMGLTERIKWAMKDSKVTDISERLEKNKSSLNLMLTILQCNSASEAESAMLRLCDLVEQVLSSNKDMSRRLRAIDERTAPQTTAILERDEDIASTVSSKTATSPVYGGELGIHRNQRGFAFEEDLLASRVYRKPLYSQSGDSLATSAARTTSSSILSALSLTDVSNISILAVPIYAHEISNSRRYTFGDFSLPPASSSQATSRNGNPKSKSLKPNKWDNFATAVWQRRRDKATKAGIEVEAECPIFGVALSESIKYANVEITLRNPLFSYEGVRVAKEDLWNIKLGCECFIYGCIPIIVAKCGVFLKENGTDVPNIFRTSGSAKRLMKLELAFNTPPRYAKGLDWTGYTVYDAASIFIRYLMRLPESVVPAASYETWQIPLQIAPSTNREEELVKNFKLLIAQLPLLSCQLLLYILDLLAVFSSKSDYNNMSAASLASIFQPSILSPVKAGEEWIEEERSRRLSQDVLIFLIEHKDRFLLGSKEA